MQLGRELGGARADDRDVELPRPHGLVVCIGRQMEG
jgi:hypothetical protein